MERGVEAVGVWTGWGDRLKDSRELKRLRSKRKDERGSEMVRRETA